MTTSLTVLVTGGAGYIGSHTVVELIQAGHQPVILDNFCNSSAESVNRIEQITGHRPGLVEGDIRDASLLRQLLRAHEFDAVMHFAGLKAVGESVEKPLEYYDNNVSGTATLLECLKEANVRRFVFSSSATVYGDPETVPITEDAATGPTNPYGRTKWMIEFVLRDLALADPSWAIANLRYFNPVGAHESGLIGEDPRGIPNNLMPFVSQVAVGRRDKLSVFGDDWDTPDGTGVRDYIHVVDLAKGHLAALNHAMKNTGEFTVNLGTGNGYSVLDMVRAFEKASGRPVPYEMNPRRAGDIATCFADPAHAKALLGWQAEKGIDEMCTDGWRWQSNNPNGFSPAAETEDEAAVSTS
jgi:UDP-glucose 4-epimerase